MPTSRRYSIEVKDLATKKAVVFTVVDWDDRDKRVAFGQIIRRSLSVAKIDRVGRRQLDALADQVSELVEGLTRHRGGRGPDWIMLHDIEAACREHGLDLHHD